MTPAILLPLATTLAVQVLVSGSSLTAAVLAALIAPDLGVPAATIGYYVATLYAFAALSGVAGGAMIARFGPLRVMQSGLVLGAVSALCLATATLPGALLAAIAGGCSIGPTTPASSAILARATDASNRNLVFSLKQTGVPGGFMVAAIGLPQVALAGGWRAAALTAAGILLAAAAALGPLRARFDDRREAAVRFSPRAQFVEPLQRVWRHVELRNISWASFAYSGLQGSLAGFLIVFLLHDTALDLVAAGVVLACAQGAGVAGRVVWGLLADRTGKPGTVLAGLGLAMACCAAFMALAAPSLPFALLIAAAIAFGGTAMAWNGVYLGEIARLAPPGRAGEATGATGLFTFGGVAFVPTVFTAIVTLADSYAAGYLFAALLPALVGGALLRRARNAGIPAP